MAKKLANKIPKKKAPGVIRVECTGADVIDIDELEPFQGSLKELSVPAYERLKTSIVDLGFSFPVAAWKSDGKVWILDAHQRVQTLRTMRDRDGYVIPKLPVIWVEAKDSREAAKKLLAATSQYGEISKQGLYEFMHEHDLGMVDLESTFKFPEIDFADFKSDFFADGTGPGSGGYNVEYTKKIAAPIYEPKSEKPPHPYSLVDYTKAQKLEAEVEAADIPDEVKAFLKMAANRHVVFDYEAIAEFYSHATPEIQDLMEKSALVIIDFKKAVENGFVVMTEKIAEAFKDAEKA